MVNQSNIFIFDRQALRAKRRRAAARFQDHDFLFDWSRKVLGDRLMDVTRSFPLALNIGGRDAVKLSPALKETGKIETLVHMDCTGKLLPKSDMALLGDEEILPFGANTLDCVISNLSLHSVNDLPGTLAQIRYALKPDGLFLAAMFGGETLHELRDSIMHTEMALRGGASPRIFPFADKPQMGELMQRSGFALPVIDSEIITVTYDNIFKLMHDLRGMGEGNIIKNRDRAYLGRGFFTKLAEYYHLHYAESDGRIRASFEIIFLLGWAPHDSQQKPLKPGSAQTRLADALHTEEIKTGEKAKP